MSNLYEFYNENGIHLHLFKRFINIYARFHNYRPKEAYIITHIQATKLRYLQIKMGFGLTLKDWFQFGLSLNKNGFCIKFFGFYFMFRLLKREFMPKDFWQSITDCCEDGFMTFEERSGSIIVIDNENNNEPSEKYRPAVYKDFYCSKYLKIYTEDLLNKDNERVLEIALPNLYYMLVSYSQTGGIFGFELNFFGSPFFDISVLSWEITLSFGKNKLSRESNLFSCASIDRYFKLKGNKKNPKDENAEQFCFSQLKIHNKYAQFKQLMKYLDVGVCIKNPRNWHFGRNIYNNRGLDMFIADLAIKYGIFKDRTGLVERDIAGEDALVKARILAAKGV